MIVLGVNRGHNAAVTLSVNKEVVFHLESERINNIRYGSIAFPAINEIKNYVDHIDVVVLSGTTTAIHKFDNGFNSDAYSTLVRGLGRSFMDHEMTVIDLGDRHHLTHAMSAHYGSGFKSSLCIVKDGRGSIVDTEFGRGREIGSSFVVTEEDIFLVDRRVEVLGLNQDVKLKDNTTLTSSMSEADAFAHVAMGIGFGGWDAGKVMGLSPYGKQSDNPIMIDGFVDRDYALSIKENDFNKMSDLCYSIQDGTEKSVIQYILNMIKKTGITDVTLSGGLFQNCVMNYKILKHLPEGSQLYVEPLSNDSGTSLGAIDWVNRRSCDNYKNKRNSLYLGTDASYPVEIPNSVSTTPKDIATMLSNRSVVAIFQGRSEAGTRALGNRSILYDPRDPDGKDRVNVVKKREWFRPFAGSILHEKAQDWFDMDKLEESPYMLYAVDVLKGKAEKIPCITHVNGTCRVQTVKESQNKNFYNLIEEFYNITGVPILLNTSFNLAGDAIVETFDDALHALYNSKIDVLYLPDIGKMIKKD